jgi:IclR family acetate operon transcriptional repressor
MASFFHFAELLSNMWNIMQITRSRDRLGQAPGERLVGSDRVLAVLSELAGHAGGISLDEIARAMKSPKPTVHRALVALRRAGFADRDSRGHYLLGDEFLRMAFAHHEERPDHIRVHDILETLAARHGETVQYAVLEGREVVYRSKVDPSSGAIRLSSTVGGRNPAHATGLGKLLLSYKLPDRESVRIWVGDRPLERRTERTKRTVEELHEELCRTRDQGYGVDDQENEPGINCIALPAFLTSPTLPSGAISISALAYRTPLKTLIDDLPAIRRLVARKTPQEFST